MKRGEYVHVDAGCGGHVGVWMALDKEGGA
jgi:hypothetical protein